MDSICSSIVSETPNDLPMQLTCATSNGFTARTAGNNTFVPCLTMRVSATIDGKTNRGCVYPLEYSICNTGSAVILYEIRVNSPNSTSVLTGPSWATPTGSKMVEVDKQATAYSSGTYIVIETGYISSSATVKVTTTNTTIRQTPLVYTALGSIQDHLSIAVSGVGATCTVLCALSWIEQY